MSKVIKLGNYKGIEFKVEKVPVSNEEVEQQIQMILAQSSQTEEKDGDTVENGDIATIDFVGLKDDVAFEGGTGNDYDLEIDSILFLLNDFDLPQRIQQAQLFLLKKYPL
jgi:trigger factor